MRRTRKIKRNVRNYFAQPNRNSIFILGNQKSGTSAIANLLSQATSKSLTPDFISAIDHPTLSLELSFDLLAFSDFVQKYKFEFSNQIIKEPILSFYIDKLIKEFPESIFILIVRNPYHNIRSILNRLSIPGDLENINYHNYDTLNRFPVWKLALQSEMLGLISSNYIEAMANRWNYIINTYLANKQNIHLIKYEDFLQDKEIFIHDLARKVGLEIVADIKDKLDIQYQPKGDQDVDVVKFFGDRNLKIIENVCGDNFNVIGY